MKSLNVVKGSKYYFLSPDLQILKPVLSSIYMDYYERNLAWLQKKDKTAQIQVQLTLNNIYQKPHNLSWPSVYADPQPPSDP